MGELLSSFGIWLVDKVFTPLLKWFKDAFLWFPKKLFELLTDGIASVVEAIPVPDFLTAGGNLFGGIDPGIIYFASVAELNTGILLIVSAYAARFLLRRIPFIG